MTRIIKTILTTIKGSYDLQGVFQSWDADVNAITEEHEIFVSMIGNFTLQSQSIAKLTCHELSPRTHVTMYIIMDRELHMCECLLRDEIENK
jgi:hypothetical protein